jgi:hypothetical protein
LQEFLKKSIGPYGGSIKYQDRANSKITSILAAPILGKRLYEERQVDMPYLDVVRKYLLVLQRCMGICMKQSQSKVHGYQPQP